MKKRIGRPTKKATAKRVALGLRVTAPIKTRLDAAAQKNGRSQSQEAEFRIERSFSKAYEINPDKIIDEIRSAVSHGLEDIRMARLSLGIRNGELCLIARSYFGEKATSLSVAMNGLEKDVPGTRDIESLKALASGFAELERRLPRIIRAIDQSYLKKNTS